MKPCPYCAEQIQDDAIKCRFCGEMLNSNPAIKVTAETAALLRRRREAKAGAPAMKGKGSPLLKFLGACLFLGGLAVAVYYIAYFDPSVAVPQTEILGHIIGGGRVNNLGLMQDKQNGLLFSGAVAVVGLALVVLSDHINK